MTGTRVVASPAALDAARWSKGTVVLRLAPDDAFAIGAGEVEVADEHAIIVDETGFVGMWLGEDELQHRVVPHIEWPLTLTRPALAQGLIAGVPAKLWLKDSGALLLCAAGYARDLADRIG
jgi:hypothetical protein